MFKILVIDDDKNTRFFLKEILELKMCVPLLNSSRNKSLN